MICPYEYWKLDDYIPTYVCDEIVKNHVDFEVATTANWNENDYNKARKSHVQWIKTPFYVNLVFDIIKQCNKFDFDISHMETLQLTRYVAPDGKYDFHYDGNGYTRKHINEPVRKLSMTCLLSDPDEFEGGVFQMETSEIYDVELSKGSLVVFPSYYRHRVTPVTKGTRYSLVGWACGEPFK
tara:strand:+ start:112 stop:657 length:546 start_codon:yes stop_codon:yes gene_type:complete